MKAIDFALVVFIMTSVMMGCSSQTQTTEQPCKWIVDEKTQEYVEVCK